MVGRGMKTVLKVLTGEGKRGREIMRRAGHGVGSRHVRTMKELVRTMFRFRGILAPGARHVAIVGPFNGWDPAAHRLARTADGNWMITVYLPPGRVVYRFDVDGARWLDPSDHGRLTNGPGPEYSVRYVRRRRKTTTSRPGPSNDPRAA
jgi:1,4-alpha-glucan branching enzyme